MNSTHYESISVTWANVSFELFNYSIYLSLFLTEVFDLKNVLNFKISSF